MTTDNDKSSPQGSALEEATSISTEVEQTAAALGAELGAGATGVSAESGGWETAGKLVSDFRLVPPVIWGIGRAVFGKDGSIGEIHAGVFLPLATLVRYAAKQKPFGRGNEKDAPGDSVEELRRAVTKIGGDVLGALCVMHPVCRRVSVSMSESLWRPLLNDALLSAQIGYLLGKYAEAFGRGRAMLAGFVARSGVPTMIAMLDEKQRETVSEEIKQGASINEWTKTLFGCEPLQISLLSLTAGGCSREAALGIAMSLNASTRPEPGSVCEQWLASYTIIEEIRIGNREKISKSHWSALGIESEDAKEKFFEDVDDLIKRNINWQWLTWAQKWMA